MNLHCGQPVPNSYDPDSEALLARAPAGACLKFTNPKLASTPCTYIIGKYITYPLRTVGIPWCRPGFLAKRQSAVALSGFTGVARIQPSRIQFSEWDSISVGNSFFKSLKLDPFPHRPPPSIHLSIY